MIVGAERRGVMLVAVVLWCTGGCSASLPRVGGELIAPVAPNRQWRPPPDAQANDSVRVGMREPPLPTRGAALTLPAIVDLALRNNPVTRESWAQAQAYADSYGAARASYLPTVDASATVTRSEQPGGSSLAPAAGPTVQSTVSPKGSLSYTLLDFGVRSGNVTSARETAYAVSFTHNATIQSTVLNVEQAYYSYVAARAVLEAQLVSFRDAEVSYDAARKMDSVGMATKADVLQAQTALAQAQLGLDTTQALLQTTRTKLAVAFGAPATAQFDVAARAEDINVADVTQSVESLVDEALRRRPDVQSAQATVRASQANVRAARGALLPSFGVSASRGYTNANVSTLSGNNYSVALSVQLPLFDGSLRRYDVARAQANMQYEAAYSEALDQSVAAQVVTSYYQTQSAAQQVRTTDVLFTSASASMDVARARYRAGVGTILDLLTAQATLASARAQRARARWTWAQQLAGLAYAVGALNDQGGAGIRTAPPPLHP